MPTVESLIKRTNYLIDDAMDVDLAIELFNEALEDIATVYGLEKRQKVDMVGGTNVFKVDRNATEIIRFIVEEGSNKREAVVRSMNGQDSEYFVDWTSGQIEYEHFGEEITLYPTIERDYKVTIDYIGSPDPIPSVDTDPSLQYVPQLPDRYHRMLPLYAGARYFENWEDNVEMRANFQKQYDKIKQDLAYQTDKNIRNTRSNRVYVYRGWS